VLWPIWRVIEWDTHIGDCVGENARVAGY
jgi:hypothetical protein